jgi:PAS domain S-box-containing protein
MKEKPTYRELEKQVEELKKKYSQLEKKLLESSSLTEETFSSRDITGHKRMEDELRKSDERFNLAMDASKDGVYEWDLETRDFYCSPGWKSMLGYDPDELPDDFSVWEKLTRPEDVEKSRQMMKEVLEGKRERFELEFDMRHKDGHWVHILSRSKIYKDASGRPARVVGTHVDITDSKNQTEHLKLSESRYRKAQELGNVGNWEYNLKTAKFWGSDQAKKIFELDPDKESFAIDEVEGCIIERERVHQAIVDLIENGKPYNLEYDIITKNTGNIKTVVSIGEIETDGAKEPLKVSGVIHDITHRKQAEKNLLKGEQRFKRILGVVPDMISIQDPDMNILFSNWQGLAAVPEEKRVENTKCYKTYRGFADVCPDCLAKEVLNTGALIQKETQLPDGRWFDIRIIPLLDKDGNLETFMEWVRDVTELKKTEESLLQAQKMESVGRLAGGVAHDFNNMLGVILGHAELALEMTQEIHDLYPHIKEIQTAAQRSADLTKQLLTFARKDIISPRKLNLNDTVESMLNMMRRLIGEDINLVWSPSSHLWPVKMDPSQINQILANLCVNARDAIAGVGKLTVETGQHTFDAEYCNKHSGFIPGDFVLVAVSDNGCGMDKDIQSNLFEPFFTTKEMGKGTGLGLATIFGIVKQNNGFINVYSEPGHGSTFKIYLPCLTDDEELDKAIPGEKKAPGGSETILLVEDEPSILRMTHIMLERKGYNVVSASTPAEAMEKAKKYSGSSDSSDSSNSIDLLMSDVVMPEMNGRDLAGQITALYPDIRILFMSGYTANVIAHQGILDDGVAFIQKPFSISDITVKVREVLGNDPFPPAGSE